MSEKQAKNGPKTAQNEGKNSPILKNFFQPDNVQEKKEKHMEPIKPITLSTAIKIAKDIFNPEYGVIEKKKAIKAIAATKFVSSITKEQLVNVIRWQAGMQKEEKKDGDS